MQYTIKRSFRKSVSIHILPGGFVEVRAPYMLPNFEIERYVSSKSEWIVKTLTKIKESNSSVLLKRSYIEGENLAYLGQEYPIILSSDERLESIVFQSAFIIPSSLSKSEVKLGLVKLYKIKAREFLSQRVESFSINLGFAYSKLRLSSAKTRWGSCTSRNVISLNWKLIMAPVDIIDYVIVHELAHIKQHNHSSDFWSIVEGIFPNYKVAKKWLKCNGHTLAI